MANNDEAMAEILLAAATSNQREAVLAEDDLVVVSAGAGSGKTRTLSWRFAWLVATGRARHDEILTITFTEKAAQEMEDKILSTLGDWLNAVRSSDLSRQEREVTEKRLELACSRFDEAQISTIHSFAMNLLKSYSQFLEISPAFNIVTPQQEDLFYQFALSALDFLDGEWFAQNAPPNWKKRIKAMISDDNFKKALDFFGPNAIVELSKAASSLFGSRGLNPEDLFKESASLERVDKRAAEMIFGLKERFNLYRNLYDFWVEEIRVEDGNNDGLSERVREFQNRWKGIYPDSPATWANFLLDLNDSLLSNIKGGGKFKKELESLLSDRFGHKGLKIHRESLSQEVALATWSKEAHEDRPLRETLLKFASMLWALWEEQKKRKNILSFDDLLTKAKDMVNKYPKAVERYKYILVDEFQDINGVQKLLIENIAAAGKEGASKLFIVGDLKQSIYRFRHADLRIFADYIEKAKNGAGKYVALKESFRMTRDLLERINDLFEYIWKNGISTSLKEDYEPLVYPETLKNEDRSGDLKILLETNAEDEDGNKASSAQRKNSLAAKLAHRFGVFHEGGVPWKDMVVLVPTRNYFDTLEEAFEREEIPAVFVDQRSFFSRSETLDATALLTALNNPEDDFALVGMLSSPFLRLSQERVSKILSSIEGEGGEGRIWRYLKTNLKGTAEKIEYLRRRAILRGPSDVLNYLLEEPLWLFTLPSNRRVRAFSNIRHLIHFLRGYEDAFGKDLAGAADYLKKTARLNAPYEEATPLGEDEDVVRIMTVHAAKGLEFPVVAVFGLEYARHPRSGSSLVPSIFVGTVASSYDDPFDRKKNPPSKAAHDYLEGLKQEEENLRLFYVACTRAKKHLILCGNYEIDSQDNPSKKTGLWLKTVLNWEGARRYADPDDIDEAEIITPKTSDAGSKKNKLPHSRGISLKKLIRPIADSPLDKFSATEYALISWCPHAYRMSYRQGLPLKWELPRSEEYGGPDVGSLVHWILSRWDLKEESLVRFFPENDENLERALRMLPTGLRPILKDKSHWPLLQRWLTAFAGSSLGSTLRRTLSSKDPEYKTYREIPFDFELESGTRLAGQIDLLYLDDATAHIWDYKITEDLDEGSFMDLYHKQLEFYGYVVNREFPQKNLLMGLYMLRESREILLDAEGISFAEIQRNIEEAALKAALGPYEKNTSHCSACPWKNACA
ncbi:UvrD-helicase domain-containing protein [Acetomicrobium sp. UBA5826]|uniref:UvrD-helicase domain-containing protein n=1 Tax=Acetomicrobium sp. UBA5826 TaxID=1946039 RepID=UPI002579FF99|nr:UvrD-helicase domain-containing protein [Acetomicrobium sp. UBA5826]